ncbi:MAG: flagellar biosynthetic protein FliO [Gammaproteobacteria bacterium]
MNTRLLISIPLLLSVSNSMAEETTAIGTGPVDATAFVQVLVGLLITVGIIFFLAWLSRKTKLINTFSSGYQIKTLATQSLTHREKICLVEVGGKQILLGLAPGNINKIHVFDDPIEAVSPAEDPPSSPFAETFRQALGMQSKETKG